MVELEVVCVTEWLGEMGVNVAETGAVGSSRLGFCGVVDGDVGSSGGSGIWYASIPNRRLRTALCGCGSMLPRSKTTPMYLRFGKDGSR